MAFRVDNIERAKHELARAGAALLDNKAKDGGLSALIAFLNPDAAQNVLAELVERKLGPFGESARPALTTNRNAAPPAAAIIISAFRRTPSQA